MAGHELVGRELVIYYKSSQRSTAGLHRTGGSQVGQALHRLTQLRSFLDPLSYLTHPTCPHRWISQIHSISPPSSKHIPHRDSRISATAMRQNRRSTMFSTPQHPETRANLKRRRLKQVPIAKNKSAPHQVSSRDSQNTYSHALCRR